MPAKLLPTCASFSRTTSDDVKSRIRLKCAYTRVKLLGKNYRPESEKVMVLIGWGDQTADSIRSVSFRPVGIAPVKNRFLLGNSLETIDRSFLSSLLRQRDKDIPHFDIDDKLLLHLSTETAN